MAVTEESRYAVHKHFEGAMGPELAGTLMELLPPVGWGDVATKQHVSAETALLRKDIDHLRESMDERFRGLDERFRAIDERFVGLDARFRAIDERFVGLEERFGAEFRHLRESIGFLHEAFSMHRDGTTARIEGAVDSLRAEFNRVMRVQLLSFVLVMTGLLSAFRLT